MTHAQTSYIIEAQQRLIAELDKQIDSSRWYYTTAHSVTDFGESAYVMIYHQNTTNLLRKIRISDHSVESTFRMQNETHLTGSERMDKVVEITLYPENWQETKEVTYEDFFIETTINDKMQIARGPIVSERINHKGTHFVTIKIQKRVERVSVKYVGSNP